MALNSSAQHLLRCSYSNRKYSGFLALVAALLTGLLFVWVPLHLAYLAVAAGIGIIVFMLDLLQPNINRRMNWMIAVLLLSAASIARGLFLQRGSQGYGLAQIQFAVLTFTIWFALAFLFREKLVQLDKTTPSSSGAV